MQGAWVEHGRQLRDWLDNPAYFALQGATWRSAFEPADRADLKAARSQEQVARRIKAGIKLRGLTQASLADELGWSDEKISRVVTGRTWVTVRTITRLEEALRVGLLRDRPDDSKDEA